VTGSSGKNRAAAAETGQQQQQQQIFVYQARRHPDLSSRIRKCASWARHPSMCLCSGQQQQNKPELQQQLQHIQF
jgi:hypothetical protein